MTPSRSSPYYPAQQHRKSYGTKLTTTAATAVYTVDANTSGAQVIGVNFCNVDGTNPVNVTLEWFDKSANVSYTLHSTISVPADTSFFQDMHELALEREDELRVTASAANDLHVVAVVSETMGGRS